jgi:hypothetical protein
VWVCDQRIPPEAISVADASGFYVVLRQPNSLAQAIRQKAESRKAESLKDVGTPAPDLSKVFPTRMFPRWEPNVSPSSVTYKKEVGDKERPEATARFKVEYVGPQVFVQVTWPEVVGQLSEDLEAMLVGKKYTFEKTYANVGEFQADLDKLTKMAWGLGGAKLV